MTKEEHEEKFIHFVSCIEDLNNAWRILKRIKKRKNNSLAYAAFQFALIEYSKPYKISYGKVTPKHWGVGTDYVPAEYVSLHTQILNKRDTFLAHSDLNIKDARLHVENNNWGKSALISQNIVDVTAEFLKIDEILDLIEKTILAMYKEQDLLISGLTPDA